MLSFNWVTDLGRRQTLFQYLSYFERQFENTNHKMAVRLYDWLWSRVAHHRQCDLATPMQIHIASQGSGIGTTIRHCTICCGLYLLAK